MRTDPSTEWRSAIRALIYCVQFDRNPLDGVERTIHAVVDGEALDRSRDDYRTAIEEALASNEPLAKLIPQDHSEGVVRLFLEAVHRRISTLG